jgi:uncharacterized membrane protein YedE/YeeE
MQSLIYTISLSLAALMGFAIHRTSLCTVRTMAEILSSRKAYMLVAVLKAVLWVMAISMPIFIFIPETASSKLSCAVTAAAIIGGFLFGIGAAVNGGCAFSTISHLASGDLWMLTTLLGFCLGVACPSVMGPMIEPCQTVPSLLLVVPKTVFFSAIVLLWLCIIWEIFRLWKSRAKETSWNQLLLSRYYRLSTGALVMGFSGGALYAFHDSWTYTNALKREVQSLWFSIEKPVTIHLILFMALFCGMLLSAWQRGKIRFRWRRIRSWPRHLFGGSLMGAGAVLIPGGNDTLVFKSLPSLSPHALPAFVSMLLGVGVALLIMTFLTGKTVKVSCTHDICRIKQT